MSDEARLAAGLLGDVPEDITVEAAAEQLRDLLSPSALWQRVGQDGIPVAELSMRPMPMWSAPEAEVSGDLALTLAKAWDDAVAGYDPPGNAEPVVRVAVRAGEDEPPAAVGPVRVVRVVNRNAHHFAWQWPIRVRVAPGPRAAAWVDAIADSWHRDVLFDVRPLTDGDREPFELLIVDGDQGDAVPAAPASCVVLVGTGRPTADLLDRAVNEFGPAVAVAVPRDDVDWFRQVLEELAHDNPLDVAFTAAVREALIMGDVAMMDATAVGRWALAVAEESGDDEVRGALMQAIEFNRFDEEKHGARAVSGAAQGLRQAGLPARLERRLAMAAAEPEDRPVRRMRSTVPPRAEAAPVAAEAEAEAQAARRLVATAMRDGKRVAKALAPSTEHSLVVEIKVPKKTDTASSEAFPEHEVTEEGGAQLDIEVSSDALGLHEVKPLFLRTDDRTLPSTPAEFTFTTGADGSLVDVKILVLHQGRPIQSARYVATVRAKPLAGDKPMVVAIPLSSAPEPRAEVTKADITLVTEGANMRRVGGSRVFDLTSVKAILDTVEQTASRALTADEPPSSLDDESAVDLLVKLAQNGSRLHDALGLLEIDADGAIAVLVEQGSPVLPLELVYAGPAPGKGAKLCAHDKPPKGLCTKASVRRVCPYAFWGMSRVIARTFAFPPKTKVEHREPLPLGLRPIVYAAADKADIDHGPEGKPSDLLAQELAALAPGKVRRVRSWRDWKSAVKAAPAPELLVVLGHTDVVDGEPTLVIGKESTLGATQVRPTVIGSGAPPLVVLLACATAVTSDPFGTLPAAFAHKGAGAIVATLTKLRGPQGAAAAAAVVKALRPKEGSDGVTLGAALADARRQLLKDGFVLGLLLVSHGEIDMKLTA